MRGRSEGRNLGSVQLSFLGLFMPFDEVDGVLVSSTACLTPRRIPSHLRTSLNSGEYRPVAHLNRHHRCRPSSA